MFWVFKLSFVVDILAFFDLATFGLFYLFSIVENIIIHLIPGGRESYFGLDWLKWIRCDAKIIVDEGFDQY